MKQPHLFIYFEFEIESSGPLGNDQIGPLGTLPSTTKNYINCNAQDLY